LKCIAEPQADKKNIIDKAFWRSTGAELQGLGEVTKELVSCFVDGYILETQLD
jgi:hypothetical protein